jgi:hypothetical protein
VDRQKFLITITVDGKDHTYPPAHIKVLGPYEKPHFKPNIRYLQEEVPVEVLTELVNGRESIVELRVLGLPKGTIKEVDRQWRLIHIQVNGKVRTSSIPGYFKPHGPAELGDDYTVNASFLKEGVPVEFRFENWRGRDQLMELRILDSLPGAAPFSIPGLVALPDLGKGAYKGAAGGLYPGGVNQRPAKHEAAGVALAGQVRPHDREGRPSPTGKIGLIAVCVSDFNNTFKDFKKAHDADPDRNPALVLIPGPEGHTGLPRIISLPYTLQFWQEMEDGVRKAGLTPAQVQVAWVEQSDPELRDPFPEHARRLQAELILVLHELPERFPNLKLAYLSNRDFGGYTNTGFHPEPYAYESGFAVKWLIEMQLKGEPALNYDPAKGAVRAPWLSWGPYLWANGTTARGDGLTYRKGDFRQDGTHLSPWGEAKVIRQLHHFLKTDSTTQPWFLSRLAPATTLSPVKKKG